MLHSIYVIILVALFYISGAVITEYELGILGVAGALALGFIWPFKRLS